MKKANFISCRNILTHSTKLNIFLTINLKAEIQPGRMSRLLKEQEKLGLTIFTYAWTAMAIALYLTVTTQNITSVELIGISLEKTYQQNCQEIIVFIKQKWDNSLATLKKIPKFKQVFAQSERTKRCITYQHPTNSVLATVYALIAEGLVLFVKVVHIPTLANIASGKFPQLAFVYQAANTKAFLSFIQLLPGKITKANPYSPVL